MKTIIFASLLMTICLFSEVQGTCKGVDGRDLSVGMHHFNCELYTCHPDQSVTKLGCAVSQCQKGKQIGYREKDLSKPYPECCDGPICAD